MISSSSSSIVLIRDLVWFVLGFLILDGPWLNEKSWIFRFFFFLFFFRACHYELKTCKKHENMEGRDGSGLWLVRRVSSLVVDLLILDLLYEDLFFFFFPLSG